MSTCVTGYVARPETVGVSPFWHQSVTIPLAFAIDGRGRPSHFDDLVAEAAIPHSIEAALAYAGFRAP